MFSSRINCIISFTCFVIGVKTFNLWGLFYDSVSQIVYSSLMIWFLLIFNLISHLSKSFLGTCHPGYKWVTFLTLLSHVRACIITVIHFLVKHSVTPTPLQHR